MNQLAAELNNILDKTIAGRLLSTLGRRIYFPKGIIAQSAEAKKMAHKANATIGMAFQKEKPLILSSVAEAMPSLSSAEIVCYAPTAGIDKVREAWRGEIYKKNPSLKAGCISLPVVTPGLSAGLSYMGDLFLEEGKTILTLYPAWDNYELIFAQRVGANVKCIPVFDCKNGSEGLDLETIKNALEAEASTGVVRLLLNFPQNPSGYSPTKTEAKELVAMVKKCAESGADVLVCCDDAYFGLFYEEKTNKESLFAYFADLHEKVLAIKIDGPTKEDYVWGMRSGFITYASKGLDETVYDALIKKTMGIIRSTVSCSNTPAQFLMLKSLADQRTAGEKITYFKLMEDRYRVVKNFITSHPNHPVLKPLPFNSGYFMSFYCIGGCAEKLRQKLLSSHGVGTIALGDDHLRVAFSSLDKEDIEPVFEIIYEAALNI